MTARTPPTTAGTPAINPPTTGDAAPSVIGIDIGGTKLAVGVCSAAGKLLASARIPTNPNESSEQSLARLVEACRGVIREAGVRVAAAGIGCVGPLDQKTGYVINPVNIPGWNRVPLVDTVREALGVPTFLDNDANAAALGEHRFGAGRGVANMVYLTISTGIGGGIVLDNRLYQGENGNAGELGHMSVNYRGRPCGCGNIGCIEKYASGTAIAERAREAVMAGAAAAGSGIVALAGGVENITALTVIEALRRGDPLAKAIWDETINALGVALANVIHIFNPHRIVLGGGVTHAGELLFEPLRRETKRHAMPMLHDVCEIVKAELGDQVGVMGAVAVALAQHERMAMA
jgi:glucokinase